MTDLRANAARCTDAYAAVAEADEQLMHIVQAAQTHGDPSLMLHQLERWRNRAARSLDTRVRYGEGTTLLAVDLPPVGSVMLLVSGLTQDAAEHQRFLHSLALEIEQHPDEFRADAIARAMGEREKASKADRRDATRRAAGVPERPSLAWWWNALPGGWVVSGMLGLVALLWGAFAAGVRVGRSPDALRTFGPIAAVGVDPSTPAPAGGRPASVRGAPATTSPHSATRSPEHPPTSGP